jgi:enoyl-CoA hydratase
MDEGVRVRIENHRAEIVLNRPEKLNAVTPQMAAAIEKICIALDRDEAVRVVLLRGEGERAFCAGSDLGALADYPSAWAFRNRVEYATAIRNMRKPVIAALHGYVLGGGAEMALSADIRIAAKGMKFGFPEVKRGWVGGGGASQMLPRLAGYGQAMRLLLLGDAVDAEEAARLGFVELIVDGATLLETAREICGKIAGYSPVAVEAVKASVRRALSAPLEAGLAYENEMNTLCFAAGDHLEGIRAFQEKRQPSFKR